MVVYTSCITGKYYTYYLLKLMDKSVLLLFFLWSMMEFWWVTFWNGRWQTCSSILSMVY